MFAGVLKHRELLYYLARSEIVTRYKQTILGPGWAVLEPVISMIVFSVVFGRIRETEIEQITVAYPVFLYAGLLPWTYFRSTVVRGANSLVGNSDLLQRVYFPREILVAVNLVVGLFDFGMSFLVLFVLMLVFHVPIRPEIVLVLPLLTGMSVLIMGLSFALSIMNARYRDIRQFVPYALQLFMFLTPVIYPPDFIADEYRWLLSLNPLTGYLEAFRSVIIGTHWDASDLSLSLVVSALVLAGGWYYFYRNKSTVADVV